MKALYTAEATTGGRNGHVKSNNNVLDVKLEYLKH
jgi:organic hydroperoxide reductase OsmC/OhrA